MAQVMEMPKLSDTMKEGAVSRWLKKEGEKVSSGLPIVEIETDKASMEYESPASGVLLKILVGDGGKCGLQDPIAIIGKQDEKWEEALEKYKAKKGGTTTSSTHSKADTTKSSAPLSSSGSINSSSTHSTPMTASAVSTERVKASPLARKMAEDLGIDLKTIQGTGPGDRIVQRDISSHSSQSTEGRKGAATAGATQKIPLTNMRRTIARRLTESVVTAPHFYLKISVNMSPLLKWRKEMLAKLPEDKKFSVNDMVIFLTSRALLKHPEVNSSWQEDHIIQYHDVQMSVAVALPGGLMTPVVRNAHELSIFDISKEMNRLVKLAKDSKLQPSDYAGGTFSISNLGMSGIEEFTAIINPPQAAILAVGGTIPTPVVGANGAVSVEERMKLTLSCDHRVIDGLTGAQFLKTLKQYFEDPVSALFMG